MGAVPINLAQLLTLGYDHADDLAVSLRFENGAYRRARLVGFRRENGTTPDFCFLHVEGFPEESRVMKETYKEAVEVIKRKMSR